MLTWSPDGPCACAEAAGDPLSALLGPGRARVVRELTQPVTSTQLAQILDISLGTVSTHLAVLREAEVVTGGRAGRNVVSRLTERGDRAA